MFKTMWLWHIDHAIGYHVLGVLHNQAEKRNKFVIITSLRNNANYFAAMFRPRVHGFCFLTNVTATEKNSEILLGSQNRKQSIKLYFFKYISMLVGNTANIVSKISLTYLLITYLLHAAESFLRR